MRDLCAKQGLDFLVDSAGTHGYHIGDPPDHRSIQIARQNSVDMSSLRARKLAADDFSRFDTLIAMDNGHLKIMQMLAPSGTAHKVSLFLDVLDDYAGQDVPDPYYGDIKGFEDVFSLIHRGCEAWLKQL